MKQLELSLYRSAEHRKRRGPQLSRLMIAKLITNGGWMTRHDLKQAAGLNDRECRLGRECAHGRIIAGQQGYKLTSLATLDELCKAEAAISAQIRSEQNNLRLLQIRRHSGNTMFRIAV